MNELLNIDLMLEDGLTPRDQRALEALVSTDPNTLTETQRNTLFARSQYLTDEAKAHFGLKGKRASAPSNSGGDDLESKSVVELKALLKASGKPVGGSKAVLLERLRA